MMINKKRALSLIVLTIFALSFIALPTVSAALAAPDVDITGPPTVDKEMRVSGPAFEVTSGAAVELYWDIVEGANAHLIGTGYGEANGSYYVEVDIPETVAGNHYVWIKDTHTDETATSAVIVVVPSVETSPSSGLPTDPVTVRGYGYPAETDLGVYFSSWDTGPWAINFTWSNSKSVETDELGSFSVSYPVPNSPTPGYGTTYLYQANDTTYSAYANFSVGASVTLSEEVGPAGNVITISGRGFTPSAVLDETHFRLDETRMYVVGDTVTVGTGASAGQFSVQVVVPSLSEGDYTLTVDDGTVASTASYEIDGETACEVNPTYGAPGATITIKGYNYTQISGKDVEVSLLSVVYGTTTTSSAGTWETTFTVPAKSFGNYNVLGKDEVGVNSTDKFKIGILALIITPTSGPAGTKVSVTGVGFNKDGTYNCTLGDIQVLTDEDIDENETLADDFYVPTIPVGTYDCTVIDDVGNELSVSYECTATTTLSASPSDVAIGYNLSLSGSGFAAIAGNGLTWHIYNSSWEMEIPSDDVNESDSYTEETVDEDGEFEGYWAVISDLILGNTYTINVSDDNDLYAETSITIVEEEVDIGPTKSSYALGETVTFKLKATFRKAGATLEIKDANGEQYFYSTFGNDEWTQVGDWWIVLIRSQVNDDTLYPYVIPEDAEVGTWTWAFDYTEDKSYNGSFEVLPTTAAQINDRINNIESTLTNVSAGLDDVTGQLGRLDDVESGLSDLASQVAANSDTLDDLSDSVSNAVNQATEAVNAAQSAVSAAQAATNAANNAAQVAQEAVSAANSAKAEAQSAKNAANQAADAADNAASAANGLSTLVYVAIGASLIAALAAIISLMQINKRIAG